MSDAQLGLLRAQKQSFINRGCSSFLSPTGNSEKAIGNRENDYIRKRTVPPIVRGSLGEPRMRPELPAWIVRF